MTLKSIRQFCLRMPKRFGVALLALFTPVLCAAQQIWSGIDDAGVDDAAGIHTGGTSDLRTTVWSILQTVLSYMGLAAVIVIVIAGIYLMVGGGEDESRQRAIKVVIYTAAGILIIFLSSTFVRFIIENLQSV